MFGDVCDSNQLLVKTMGKQKGLCLSSHTHTPVCLYRCFCLAYFIKKHTRVPPAVAQKYDPEMFVSEKQRMPVEKIEINGKNTDFHEIRFHKLRAGSSSLNMAEEREEEGERKWTQECAPQ